MPEIEKGIPLPLVTSSRASYPWPAMEVGDSVHFLAKEYTRNMLYQAFRYYGRGHNKKFALRKTDTGYRVWRIE